MCAFECDSCLHKIVCETCPSSATIIGKCAQYANVKILTDVQQLKAEIAVAVLGLETLSTEDFDNGGAEKFIGLLRQLSAI